MFFTKNEKNNFVVEIFKNEKFGEIRIVTIDGEPWFIAKDISDILGYRIASDMTRRIDTEDKGTHLMSTFSGNQNMSIINESGLYTAILNSKLESAKQFKRWVTNEVLPSIRKHGAYMTNETLEKALLDPDFLISLATELKSEKEKRIALENKVEQQKPLVDFANQISDTTDLIDMKTMAKLLKEKNMNISRNRLFDLLRIKKILMRDNQPYQQYIDAGYFKVNEYTYTTQFGQTKTNRQTLITGKGQLYIYKKVKEFMSMQIGYTDIL